MLVGGRCHRQLSRQSLHQAAGGEAGGQHEPHLLLPEICVLRCCVTGSAGTPGVCGPALPWVDIA